VTVPRLCRVSILPPESAKKTVNLKAIGCNGHATRW
jgi:hypothetical protein